MSRSGFGGARIYGNHGKLHSTGNEGDSEILRGHAYCLNLERTTAIRVNDVFSEQFCAVENDAIFAGALDSTEGTGSIGHDLAPMAIGVPLSLPSTTNP